MPALDTYHYQVKNALIKDGWTITHDPLKYRYGAKMLYADLGAERIFAAQKHERKILVEVKSFIGASIVADLEDALGQYVLYDDVLSECEPDRIPYLAIRDEIFETLFQEPLGQLVLRRQQLNLVVFDPVEEVIVQWIP